VATLFPPIGGGEEAKGDPHSPKRKYKFIVIQKTNHKSTPNPTKRRKDENNRWCGYNKAALSQKAILKKRHL
jgi:hypothetical protein